MYLDLYLLIVFCGYLSGLFCFLSCHISCLHYQTSAKLYVLTFISVC